jgi:hypothetical protein
LSANHIITTKEIKDAWNNIQAWKPYLRNSSCQSQFEHAAGVNKWRGTQVDRWIGCSGEQMQGWLCEGYYPEDGEIPNVDFSSAPVKKRRYVSNDEAGELQVDAVLAGDDYIYRAYSPREVPRNINVVIDSDFSASTKAEVISQYLEWNLRLIEALQKRGLAPGLSLAYAGTGSFREHSERVGMEVPLAKSGEEIDAISWRAFFTKGAFRTLGFLAMGIVGDRHGWHINSTLGYPDMRSKYGVTFDEDSSTLYINSPNSPHKFDAAEMNALVESAGVL